MTVNEAYYVLDHRHDYHADTVRWAMDLVERYERQGGVRNG